MTNAEWVLSMYCLLSTVKLHHLDSTLFREAGGCPTSFCDQTFLNLTLLPATGWRAALVDMCVRMNICVCIQTSVCIECPFPISSDLAPARHFLRITSYTRSTSGCVRAVSPGRAVVMTLPRDPFTPGKLFIVFRVTPHSEHHFKKWYSKEEVIFRNDIPFSFLKRLPSSFLKRSLHFWISLLPLQQSTWYAEWLCLWDQWQREYILYEDGNVLWTENVSWNHVVCLTVGCLVRLRDGPMFTLHWKCNTVCYAVEFLKRYNTMIRCHISMSF